MSTADRQRPCGAAPGYERRDVGGRGLLVFSVAFVVVVVLVVAGLTLLGNLLWHQWRVPPGLESLAPTPRSGLQVDAAADLAALEGRAAARLDSYGMVDAARGIAHIPIDRAMELLVERRGGGGGR